MWRKPLWLKTHAARALSSLEALARPKLQAPRGRPWRRATWSPSRAWRTSRTWWCVWSKSLRQCWPWGSPLANLSQRRHKRALSCERPSWAPYGGRGSKVEQFYIGDDDGILTPERVFEVPAGLRSLRVVRGLRGLRGLRGRAALAVGPWGLQA